MRLAVTQADLGRIGQRQERLVDATPLAENPFASTTCVSGTPEPCCVRSERVWEDLLSPSHTVGWTPGSLRPPIILAAAAVLCVAPLNLPPKRRTPRAVSVFRSPVTVFVHPPERDLCSRDVKGGQSSPGSQIPCSCLLGELGGRRLNIHKKHPPSSTTSKMLSTSLNQQVARQVSSLWTLTSNLACQDMGGKSWQFAMRRRSSMTTSSVSACLRLSPTQQALLRPQSGPLSVLPLVANPVSLRVLLLRCLHLLLPLMPPNDLPSLRRCLNAVPQAHRGHRRRGLSRARRPCQSHSHPALAVGLALTEVFSIPALSA